MSSSDDHEVEESFQFLEPNTLRDGELELQLVETRPGDPTVGFVPAYHFRMVRAKDRVELGDISFRVGDTEHVVMYAGHIAYNVDEAHRGQRYAARATRLLLPLARRHGFTALWITCNPDNLASRRTCELVGATFVEVVDLPEDTDMYESGEREKCRYHLQL